MMRFYESLQMPGGGRVRVSYGCLGGIVIAVFWTLAWLVYGALWLAWQLARGLVLGTVWLVRQVPAAHDMNTVTCRKRNTEGAQ